MTTHIDLEKYREALQKQQFISYKGQVSKVVGLTIESNGPETRVGELCRIINPVLKERFWRKLLVFTTGCPSDAFG